MITEDYCSYEVSKLLREKVFPFVCMANSIWINKQGEIKLHTMYAQITVNKNEEDLPCVTQALAMKYLRNMYDIIIIIDYDEDEDCEEDERYGFTIYYRNKRDVGVGTYLTYEKAVDAALKYCLTYML